MAGSSVAQEAWTPPPLETMEAKREWVNQLHHEAALMSAQADFHLRCDLAGYHSNYHALLARLAQGLPLTQEDGARLVEQFKGLSLAYPQCPVTELTPRVLVRLARTLQYCGVTVEACYLYLTAGHFAAAAARLPRRADDAAYVAAARGAYEAARIEVGPPPLRPASQFDRAAFARLIPQVRLMRARALTWAHELAKLEKEQATTPDSA